MGTLNKSEDNIIIPDQPKKLPIEILLDYLLEKPERMLHLVDGLEEYEFSLSSVVKTAVTCNLYKIIYGAGRLTIEYPQELSDAVVSMSYRHIEAFVQSLCDTYIKNIIKNQEYEQ